MDVATDSRSWPRLSTLPKLFGAVGVQLGDRCPGRKPTLPLLSTDAGDSGSDAAEHRQSWYRLETAKRRLVASLRALGLPVRSKYDDPEGGLAFEFKSDEPLGDGHVVTGHANGIIIISVAEADDAERERRRKAVHEPYRTLLGHFRHESGHYYWDRPKITSWSMIHPGPASRTEDRSRCHERI